MQKKLTCIECPNSCRLTVDYDEENVHNVEGNICIKGEIYAKKEVINPVRYLTSTVPAKGLTLKMVPVRTDQPIPKDKISEAMQIIRKIKISKPVSSGEIIKKNLLDLNVNLVATRSVG